MMCGGLNLASCQAASHFLGLLPQHDKGRKDEKLTGQDKDEDIISNCKTGKTGLT